MKRIFFLFSVFAALTLPGANLIRNGSFEQVRPDGTPDGWNVYNQNNAEATMTASGRFAADGKKSLRVTNKTPITANVYGAMSQGVPVQADTRYRISLMAKGGQLNTLQFALGKKWDIRLPLNELTDEWALYSFEFTPRQDQLHDNGDLHLVLLCEGVTEETWIDDIQLRPASEPISSGMITPANFVQTFMLPVNKAEYSGKTLPASDDFSAKIRLHARKDGLHLVADVTDDVIRTVPGAMMWQQDSLQIRLDPVAMRALDPLETDLELGFAPTENGVATWNWAENRELTTDEAKTVATRTANGYRIETLLSWKLLDQFSPQNGVLSYNLAINDSDKDGDRRIAFLASGLHDFKSSAQNRLLFLDDRQPRLSILLPESRFTDKLDGELYITNLSAAENWSVAVELTDSNGKKHDYKLDGLRALNRNQQMRLLFDMNLEAIPDGDFTIRFTAPDGSSNAVKSRKEDRLEFQKATLAAIGAEYQELKSKIEASGKTSYYFDLYLSTMEREIKLHGDNLNSIGNETQKRYYLNRGESTILPELKQSLLQLRELTENPPQNSWRMLTSPQTLKDHWPLAEMISDDGRKENRIVYLGGYGHFPNGLRPDMTRFPAMGGNIVHVELGPTSFFNKNGAKDGFNNPDTAYWDGPISEILRLAHENNQRVLLLISPHYAPGWWKAKYPEALAPSGFLPYDVNHPKSREMMAAYLDVLLPLIARSPYREAIHSICLSNEPTYNAASPESELSRSLFTEWLKAKYGDIAAFNRKAQTKFESFPAIATAAANDPVALHEFNVWKREAFAEWHAWMAAKIRKALPGIPIQSKIMIFFTLEPRHVAGGVDPELFADLSDFNGNDNYMFYRQGKWAADWGKVAFYHDLQYSFKPAPIVNGESHVIPDGDKRPVPYEHIYTATFQQYASGASGLLTWLWDDFKWDNPTTLHGNISRRPLATIAQGRATLDANRLANELLALRNAPAETALLYSPTAYLYDPETYGTAIRNLHEELCFTGHPVTFLSERQLAKKEFGAAKVLILTSAVNVDSDAWLAIGEFAAKGGKVLYSGKAPARNEFNRPLKRIAMEAYTPQKFSAFLRKPLLSVKTEGKNAQTGVYYRAVPTPEGELINLVNYNRDAVTLQLEFPAGVRVTELISGKEIGNDLVLPTLTPMLLELK